MHKKKTSENGEAIDPNDPALLVGALEKTQEGHGKWLELRL